MVIATGIPEEGGRVLVEMHDGWIAFPRRYLPEGSMDKVYPQDIDQLDPATPLHGT